jgi:hypothetical protein
MDQKGGEKIMWNGGRENRNQWWMARLGIAAVFVFSPVTVYSAGNPADSDHRVAQAPQPPSFSERELSAFVKAYIELNRLKTTYDGRIFTAPNSEEAQKLTREFETKTSEVLEHEGLEANTYSDIFEAIQNDDGIRQKVTQLMREQP